MCRYRILFVMLAGLLVPLGVHAQSSRQQLQELTAQLQKSRDDQALRESIIRLALTLNPKPAIPDAATMAEGAAEYASKNAQNASDYSESAKQYEKVLLIAPWIAADYFNCAVAHEKAGENKEAIRNFGLYVLAAPNADDLQAVKKRIGGLQYAVQKAENEANKVAKEAAAPNAVAPLFHGIQRYECPTPQNERTVSQNFKFDFSTHRVIETIQGENRSGDYDFSFEEAGELLIIREGCAYSNKSGDCKSINRTTGRLSMRAWGPNGGEDRPHDRLPGDLPPYIVEYTCRVAQ